MRKPNPTKEAAQTQNPSEARNAKSGQSVPGSKNKGGSPVAANFERSMENRPSVRAELKKYREEIDKTGDKARTAERAPKFNEHKEVKKKKGKKK